jgi:hypothetical protein
MSIFRKLTSAIPLGNRRGRDGEGGDQVAGTDKSDDGKKFHDPPISFNDDDRWLNKTLCGPWTGPKKRPGQSKTILVSSVWSHCGATDGDDGPWLSWVPTTNRPFHSPITHLSFPDLSAGKPAWQRVQGSHEPQVSQKGRASTTCSPPVRLLRVVRTNPTGYGKPNQAAGTKSPALI